MKERRKPTKIKTIQAVYEDPASSSGLGGVDRLFGAFRKKYKKADIKSFLQGLDGYTLHKPAKKTYKTAQIIAEGIDHVWSVDLADFSRFAVVNDGYKYLLFCIDTVSRYLFIEPVKTKRPSEVGESFVKIILSSGRKCGNLNSDAGTEFTGKPFQDLLDKLHITHYVTGSDKKASLVERVIRTVKERMARYFTIKNSYRYIDKLQSFVIGYNDSIHRTIKAKPASIFHDRENFVLKKLYDTNTKNFKKVIFSVGDKVRVSKIKTKFQKGYEQRWSREIFEIDQVLHRKPLAMYRIKDLNGVVLKGAFYNEELQKINVDDKQLYKIEKILNRRKVGKDTMLLVKWEGYNDSFNSYIKSKDLSYI